MEGKFPPFIKKAAVAETVAEQTAPKETPQEEEKVEKEKKKAKRTTAASKPMDPAVVEKVIQMVKTKGYKEIANELGLTKFQVGRILTSTKKQLREAAKEKGPKAVEAVEKFIQENLSRPAAVGVPGAAKEGKVKEAINSIVDGILKNLI